jgi:hypothetical protein
MVMVGGPGGDVVTVGVGGAEVVVGVGFAEVVVGVGFAVLVGCGLSTSPTSARGGKSMTRSPARAAFMNAVQTRAG